MLIASNYILNQTSQPFAHEIFPYLHSFSNHLSTEAHLLQKVLIPDIVPAEALAGVEGEFSLVAGDFEEVYGGAEQKGQWAAVTTCFFIDCVSDGRARLCRVSPSLTAGAQRAELPADHI